MYRCFVSSDNVTRVRSCGTKSCFKGRYFLKLHVIYTTEHDMDGYCEWEYISVRALHLRQTLSVPVCAVVPPLVLE